MDEFLLGFDQHVGALKKKAWECWVTGGHDWKKDKAVAAIINGEKVTKVPCGCGTIKKTTRKRGGGRKSVYIYPEGYRREPGCGPRTLEINDHGFDLWSASLPMVSEL